MISMDKQYRTCDGRKVRILCVDRKGSNAVIALIECGDVEQLYHYDKWGTASNPALSLVEYHPTQDWPVNHPIWVRYFDSDVWYPRHFAKYKDGCVYTWKDGGTSHTTHDTTCWSHGTDVNPNQEK